MGRQHVALSIVCAALSIGDFARRSELALKGKERVGDPPSQCPCNSEALCFFVYLKVI